MGLFGNSEEKQARKLAEQQKLINAEKERLAPLKGKYITNSFTSPRDDRYAFQHIYNEISEYANTYNLEITKISNPSEGFISKTGVTVIFKVL